MSKSPSKPADRTRPDVVPFPPHDLGAWGETTAARRLVSDGWAIVERNLCWGRREIDLVVRRGSLLAFVEVKTRSCAGFGGPEGAVTWKKRREIEAVARAYLARHPGLDLDIRFDVIAIVCDVRRRVLSYVHIEGAWRPDA
ncbi:MAG: YraN family protein [Gemmatimonadetes bacterium]|nr:YraN family protein [Gemmatimonadota bacterium]NNF14652.1 YraN family protein [Gemmatimonadota bacterium]